MSAHDSVSEPICSQKNKQTRRLADPDLAIGDERVGRTGEIGWGWTASDAARRVVLRSMAGAKEPAIVAFVSQRDTSKVGTDPNHDEPLVMAVLHPRGIGLRIGQRRDVDVLRLLDFLLGPMPDVDRLAAPEDLDRLVVGDRSEVYFDRRTGGNGRGVRIHLRNQRDQNSSAADCAYNRRGNVEKIAARWLGRRHCCHGFSSFPVAGSPSGQSAALRPQIPPSWAPGRAGGPPWEGGQSRRAFYWHPCRESARATKRRTKSHYCRVASRVLVQ